MRKLSKWQSELLKAIQVDPELRVWLYYSISYNHGVENIARDFVSKLNNHRRHPHGDATRVSDVKAIIPQFIAEYDECAN